MNSSLFQYIYQLLRALITGPLFSMISRFTLIVSMWAPSINLSNICLLWQTWWPSRSGSMYFLYIYVFYLFQISKSSKTFPSVSFFRLVSSNLWLCSVSPDPFLSTLPFLEKALHLLLWLSFHLLWPIKTHNVMWYSSKGCFMTTMVITDE